MMNKQQQQQQTQQTQPIDKVSIRHISINTLPSHHHKTIDTPRGLMKPSGLFDIEPNDGSFLDPLSFGNTLFDMNENCNSLILDSFTEQDLANLSTTDFGQNFTNTNLNTFENAFEFTDKKSACDELVEEIDSSLLPTPNSVCNLTRFEDLYENNLDLNMYIPAHSSNSLSSFSDLVPLQLSSDNSNDAEKQQMTLKMPSRQNSFNLSMLDFDECQYNLMMTPTTEKLCFDFIQSPKECDNENESNLAVADVCSQQNIASFVDEQLSQISNEAKLDSVLVDHDYAIASKKRKISENDDEDTVETQACSSAQTDGVFKTPSAKTSKAKKQRTRGIYRADDIKTEEDRENYLERRRKNNISSKASRQSKKQQYVEMDAKADQLESQNKTLKGVIQKYSETIDELKELLLQKYTAKKN